MVIPGYIGVPLLTSWSRVDRVPPLRPGDEAVEMAVSEAAEREVVPEALAGVFVRVFGMSVDDPNLTLRDL